LLSVSDWTTKDSSYLNHIKKNENGEGENQPIKFNDQDNESLIK